MIVEYCVAAVVIICVFAIIKSVVDNDGPGPGSGGWG